MTIVSCSVYQTSTVDQGSNALSTQADDPTTEQLKGDAQIETIDTPVQEVCPILTTTATIFDALSPKGVVSEKANPEKSSATIQHSNGHSDTNSLSVEQNVGVEHIEESLVLPAEDVQEPRVDAVGPEFDAVPATITDELSTTESNVIDHPIEGPQAEPEAKDNAPDRLEAFSQSDIMATDETSPPTRDCDVSEPSESAPVLLELPVEQPEILERTGSSITDFSISAAETGASLTNVTTEPVEDPKFSMENPESK